jgi:hypothetical protein
MPKIRTTAPIPTWSKRHEAARIGPKSPSQQEMSWQTRTSAWNLRGCHGDFERKWNLGRPKTGSALHHLVTAFSVKKGLMIFRGIAACGPPGNGDAVHPHSAEKRKGMARFYCLSQCATG